MTTEVEIRGPLTLNEYRRLYQRLKHDGRLIKRSDQLAIFFKVKKNNLSLKKDHDLEKLVLKFGQWQRGNRKEIEVLLQKEQFTNALNLLKGLGFSQGYKAPAHRSDFRYHGVQISLKTKAVIGPHYEMETTTSQKNQIKLAQKKLLKIARSLGLKIWTEKEYRRHTHQMWQRHHPGPQKL